MNKYDINNLAEDALNLAVRHIQNELNIKTGDFAALFFSDDLIQRILSDYIRAEISEGVVV
jgi:hypothetical protein